MISSLKCINIRQTDCIVFTSGILFMALACLVHMFVDCDEALMFAWISVCVLFFIAKLQFAIKYIHYFVFLTLNIVGVYIIDNNVLYLNELRITSADYNALLPLIIIHFAFLMCLFVSDRLIPVDNLTPMPLVEVSYNNRNVNGIIIDVLGAILAVITVFLFIKAATKPAFLMGYDRFEYSKMYITGIWEKANKYISWLLPLIPILLFNKKRKLGISILLLYSLYLFLIGNKFGSFFSLLIMLTPYLYYRFKLNKITHATIIKVALAAVFTGFGLIIVLYAYHRLTYGHSIEDFKIYLYQRVAQQGQMWWAVYGKCQNTPNHFNEIWDEIIGFWGMPSVTPDKMDYGIYKMMQLVTPYDTYVTKILSGSRYTMSTCSSMFYYTGYWGFVLSLPLAGAALAYMVNWYWRSLYGNEVIGAIVSWIMIGRLATIFTMSEFQMVFNLKYLFILLVAVAIDRYLCTKRSRNTDDKYQSGSPYSIITKFEK